MSDDDDRMFPHGCKNCGSGCKTFPYCNSCRKTLNIKEPKQKKEPPKQVLSRREKVYERDGRKCLFPGCMNEDLTIDHIVPLSKGGSNKTANLQTLCKYHNGKKGANTIDYRK